jgi:hypothetical protein
VAKAELPQATGYLALVPSLPVAVHQRHRRTVDAALQQIAGALTQRHQVERQDLLAGSVQPFIDLDHCGVQRLGLDDRQGEQVGAPLVADAQEVAKTARDEQSGGGTAALEQGVRATRGRQPHPDRWQLLIQPPAGHQPGRQQRRLLRRQELERSAVLRRRRQLIGEFQAACKRIAACDR